MGFFSWLFKKKTEYIEEEFDYDEWDNLQIRHKKLDLSNPSVREQYVRSCLEEMKVSSEEIDKLTNEYAVVTSYLTDMEEVEAIPKAEKKEIEKIARNLHDLRINHDAYILKETTMTSAEYAKIEAIEDEVCDAYAKIHQEEEYRDKVKRDLSRIDRERRSYDYRKGELSMDISNFRGTAIIVMISAAVLTVLLFLLQFMLGMDVKIGYYITVALVAISLAYLYIRYVDSVAEKKRVDSTINELILLENKVKIRYVNNKNLLDYYYIKYDIDSGKQLKTLYDKFLVEREDRRKYEQNEDIYIDEMAKLITALRRYRIQDPEIWLHQTEALVDPREMVEIRHKLIGRRQKLRKQLEYNEAIVMEASDEIKKVIADYPESKNAIMHMIDAYEKLPYKAHIDDSIMKEANSSNSDNDSDGEAVGNED